MRRAQKRPRGFARIWETTGLVKRFTRLWSYRPFVIAKVNEMVTLRPGSSASTSVGPGV